MFEDKDLRQIKEHGLTEKTVEWQLGNFISGFPHLPITGAASVGDGIIRTDERQDEAYAAVYDRYAAGHCIMKFVPASGAATRMFKDLFEFIGGGRRNDVTDELLANLDRFAFADALRALLPAGADDKQTVEAIVTDKGLGYGAKPKGLIFFHKYAQEVRTAIEEHLVEGACYAACNGRVNIHFTVSPEHRDDFGALLDSVAPKYEERFGVKYGISMSEQKSSTDMIAVNPDNTLFRNADGSALFRPAGHGALIENLHDIDADLVFIKNIDNVTTDGRRADTVKYKKTLAGMLVSLQERVYGYLEALDKGADCALTDEIAGFIESELCVRLPERPIGDAVQFYRSILDRPIRVCGMVRNEGEPGGGPFWAANADGTVSLQIAEASQISPENAVIMKSSTHFNPVDLVCGVKNYKGAKYDLRKYVDPATGFISEKSKDGKPLRAQELPGLWNGAMSRWNTIFVEVPISTFTPVKVVTDLLRPQHQ